MLKGRGRLEGWKEEEGWKVRRKRKGGRVG